MRGLDVLLCSGAVASLCFLVAFSHAGKPLRSWVTSWSGAEGWCKLLVHCPFCLSFWFASPVLLMQAGVVTWLAITTFSTLLVGGMLRLLK